MNLNHLAIFHSVAEAGSVTAGAERLQISQPATSKQIRELEVALGVPLFDRVGRGLRLTEPGRVLAGYARKLFALESEAEQAVGKLRTLERGTLFVGASTTIGSYLIPVVLSAFHRRYPGVRVHVEVGNTESIHRAVLENRLDVGLTEGLIPGNDLDAKIFACDELVGIAAPNHPIVGQKQVRAQEFAELPFVLRESGSGTRAVIEHALDELGLRAAEIMSVGSTEAIKSIVASGLGVAIVSRLAIMSEEEMGTLAVVTLLDLQIPRPLRQIRPKGYTGGPALRAFDEVLAETLPPGFRYRANRRAR